MEKNITVTQNSDGTVEVIHWYEGNVYIQMKHTELYCDGSVNLDLDELQKLKEKYFK